MTSPDRPTRFRPPIAGAAAKTGWEALEKWVGGGGGGAAPAADAAAPAAPSGKTGWEALGKWVGGGGGAAPAAEAAAPAAPSGKTGWEALDKWVGGSGEKVGEAVERAVGTVQERAAELKEDLKEIREKLPMDEIETAGKGLLAALKKMFRGK